MSDPRLCIATLDPTSGGGVSTMARFVYHTAERAGYDPYLAYNRVDLDADIRPWEIHRATAVDVTYTEFDGMEARHVPRVLPEFEFAQYRFNRGAWSEMLADANIYFGVGGNNLVCHPFVLADCDFGCWVATLLWDDRSDRLADKSLGWRMRDRLSRPLLERLERQVFEESSISYALSEYTADRITNHPGLNRDHIEVVPYPIDTDTFTPENPAVNEAGDDLRVLFVGRITDPRKNTASLLDAFEIVRESVPNARLQLIGDDPTDALRSRARELGITESVEFVGYVDNDNLPSYYREADVFVIPSHQEGLGIVGLEAMACGTPVVSTRCGGPEQYVTDDQTGYLVPTDDAGALADKIVRILTHSDLRDRLGKTARERIERQYAASTLAPRFVDALKLLE